VNQPAAISGRDADAAFFWGCVCAFTAAIGYTAANICLRAVTHLDPFWVSAVKSFPTVALAAPYLLATAVSGERVLPTKRIFGMIVLAGLFGQLGGNVCFQWSLGVIGMALAVPMTLGSLLIGGAVLGRMFLHEPVSLRMTASMAVLVFSICVLSFGAADASMAVRDGSGLSSQIVLLGVGAAVLCGFSYAVLGVVIRHGVTGRASISTTLFTIGMIGMTVLGGLCYQRLGWEGMLATSETDFAIMLLAGIFNAGAFLALTKSLQLIGVTYVNSLNGCQTALAALGGVLIFGEPLSGTLWLGTALTVVGLLMMKRPATAAQPPHRRLRPRRMRNCRQSRRCPPWRRRLKQIDFANQPALS